jgi:hypothetical protein
MKARYSSGSPPILKDILQRPRLFKVIQWFSSGQVTPQPDQGNQ